MPPLFFERIRKMRICAWTELLCFILLLFFAGVFCDSLFRSAPLWPAFLIAFIFAFGFYYSYSCFRKYGKPEPYSIPISVTDFDSVVQALGAASLDKDACLKLRKHEDLSLRILALYCRAFDKKELDKKRKKWNKRINKDYQIRSTGPRDVVGRRMRINLVVCDSESAEVYNWVSADTAMLLHRVEAIVSAALILDERKLLFPACMQHLTIAELKRYETAALVLINCLTSESPK